MALYKGDVDKEKGGAQVDLKEGDRMICCLEDTSIKEGDAAPYANCVLRVLAGPTNDASREMEPRRMQKDGKEIVAAKPIFEIMSFSGKSFCRQKIAELMSAIGHKGAVNIETKDDWEMAVLDREVCVIVKLEEYKGKMKPRVGAFEPLTAADWREVVRVYDEFGTARGLGWSGDPVPPINAWDYDNPPVPGGLSGVTGGRRGAAAAQADSPDKASQSTGRRGSAAAEPVAAAAPVAAPEGPEGDEPGVDDIPEEPEAEAKLPKDLLGELKRRKLSEAIAFINDLFVDQDDALAQGACVQACRDAEMSGSGRKGIFDHLVGLEKQLSDAPF